MYAQLPKTQSGMVSVSKLLAIGLQGEELVVLQSQWRGFACMQDGFIVLML